MFRFIGWLALIAALSRPPDMEGKATFYADYFEGRLTRSEEVFSQAGLTAAVDDAMWSELRGKEVVVCAYSTQQKSGSLSCTSVLVINDTGYLAEHGIVVDLSKRAFQQLAPLRQGVVWVRVWIIKEERY